MASANEKPAGFAVAVAGPDVAAGLGGGAVTTVCFALGRFADWSVEKKLLVLVAAAGFLTAGALAAAPGFPSASGRFTFAAFFGTAWFGATFLSGWSLPLSPGLNRLTPATGDGALGAVVPEDSLDTVEGRPPSFLFLDAAPALSMMRFASPCISSLALFWNRGRNLEMPVFSSVPSVSVIQRAKSYQ